MTLRLPVQSLENCRQDLVWQPQNLAEAVLWAPWPVSYTHLDVYKRQVERQGDHQDSPYFTSLDYYNMESTDTLTIISNFKTQQQTSEWSCGISSIVMVLEHYGLLGDYNEETLAQMRSNGLEEAGTTLKDVVNIIETVTGLSLIHI